MTNRLALFAHSFIYYEIVHIVHIQNNMKIRMKVVHKKTNRINKKLGERKGKKSVRQN